MAADDFVQMSELRVGIYRMLASLYFTELTSDQIATLAECDYGTFGQLDEELSRGAKEVARCLRHVNPATREELAVDYAHTFLAAAAAKAEKRAVPFESCFTSETGLLMGPARESVYKMMLKEGVLPDASLKVPEDHISFEFEFMAHLAEKSTAMYRRGDVEGARESVALQKEFWESHLIGWISDFCTAVECVCRTRFYRGIALMTRAFVRLDGELLDESARMVVEETGEEDLS